MARNAEVRRAGPGERLLIAGLIVLTGLVAAAALGETLVAIYRVAVGA